MNDPSEPHDKNIFPGNHQVKAEMDIFVPVARKFILNYHGDQEPSGEEYSITLEVLQDQDLPLRMTMGSADNTDLLDRCFQVLKSGFIAARGELVFDHKDGDQHCIHLLDVHWFEAVEVTGAS